jgi:hypothetical protein
VLCPPILDSKLKNAIFVFAMSGAVAGFMLYRRSILNKPQTLNDKISNPDYSSYIDDTLRVSAGKLNQSRGGSSGGGGAAGAVGGARCRQERRGFASPPYLKVKQGIVVNQHAPQQTNAKSPRPAADHPGARRALLPASLQKKMLLRFLTC